LPEVAFTLPVVPGKEELDRETFEEMNGARRAEYESALRAAGISRHAVWHQNTPAGTVAVVYVEADDESAVGQFGSSDAPLNSWFREQMKEVHGIDISEAQLDVKVIHDIRL
jgi:hypothetical protein